MKKLIFILLLTISGHLMAQNREADSMAIRKACYDYVEGFYTSDSARVAKAVHTQLSKRLIDKRGAVHRLYDMSAKDLIGAAHQFKKGPDKNPQEPFKLTVHIYDIDEEIALAKIENNKMGFFDYVHVGKVNGEWKIINVLWAMKR